MFEGVSRVLGAGMWRNALLGFSRASESAAPPGQDFHDFVAQRAQQARGGPLGGPLAGAGACRTRPRGGGRPGDLSSVAPDLATRRRPAHSSGAPSWPPARLPMPSCG